MNKFNVKITKFNHHRDGWNYATQEMDKIHSPNSNILFLDWADKFFKNEKLITKPWSGILHNVLCYPDIEKYKNVIFSISDLIKKDFFIESLNKCVGIFTLCKHTKEFLERNIDIPVENIKHPVNLKFKLFNLDNLKLQVVTIGQWMRRYESICELDSNKFKKKILTINGFEKDYQNINNIDFIKNLNNEQYDELLSSSIVFLDLYDSAACNTILECISRNTPVLVNLLPATIEYLGINYPFFYQSLEEASFKLNDMNLIEKTHNYLTNMNKNSLSSDNFINSILNSKIYKNIKTIKIL